MSATIQSCPGVWRHQLVTSDIALYFLAADPGQISAKCHDYKNKELYQLYFTMSVACKGTLLLQVTLYYTPIMAVGYIDNLNFLIIRPNIVQRQHGLFALTARLPRRSLSPELSKDISQVGRAIFFGNKWIVNLHAWLTVLDHKISCRFLTIRLSLYHHNYSTIE